MSDAQTLATAYLSPSTDSLWRWSADGDALTWSDGSTIAFRQEVEFVLAGLAPQGLPPFGSVAMLLAACRPGWEQSAGRGAFLRYANVFSQWRAGAESAAGPAGALHGPQLVFQRVAKGIQQVVEGLDAVSRFGPEARQTKQAKATLAEAVFESTKNRRLTREESALVVQALADGINPERLTLRSSSSEALREFADDADALRTGLPLVNEQALALRQRTGLDELPQEPDDLDLAPAERVRRLLAELRKDKELAGLARLAQDLMAAVHVPRTLRQQEELPLGGVSDLSNRGPLDRLLVTELANDDLTLAVRVAVNEALYLRRESPPRQPPNRRAILIDVGIRMWGVPRVFGAAVALAMAATADPRAELLVFRATPTGVEPVDLTTRRGLTACLETLEPTPHPGSSMRAFLAAAKGPAKSDEGDAGDPVDTDAVLITHPDVLADHDFCAALRHLDDPPMFAATVDRDGAFALMSLTSAGRKPVRKAALSLDAILAPDRPADPASPNERPSSRLIVKDLDPDLPSIFAVEPFPLRLPYAADPKLARASQRHGLVAVTKDGRLLHWDGPQKAARQLTALLPAGRMRGMWIDDSAGRAHVLFDQTKGTRCRLVSAELATGVTTSVPVQPTALGPMAACVHRGVLLLVFRQKERDAAYLIEAYDLATGASAGSMKSDRDVEHVRDRFFREHGGQWKALSHDGHRPVIVDVTFPGQFAVQRHILNLFDRAGHDGPWAVLSEGRIIDGAGREFDRRFTKLPVHWKFVGVSGDGNRLVLAGVKNHLLDFVSNEGPRVVADDAVEELLAPQIHWSTRFPPKVRTDFSEVFIGDGALLSLVTPKSQLFQIDVNHAGELILKQMGRLLASRNPVGFKSMNPPRGMRIELSAATWKCGSRAYLDSRGLLHLRSHNRAVPEVSLVLSNEKLAAYAPFDNITCGPAQFVGDCAENAMKMITMWVRHFISNLNLS